MIAQAQSKLPQFKVGHATRVKLLFNCEQVLFRCDESLITTQMKQNNVAQHQRPRVRGATDRRWTRFAKIGEIFPASWIQYELLFRV